MTTEIARLAARVAALEKQLARTTRTARLAYSSIENGAVEVFDDDGSLRAIIGQQPDGTSGVTAVNGAPPPTPAAPTAVPVLGGIAVTWTGAFTDTTAVPLDWARLEIHTSTTDGFEPNPGTLRATLESPQGGTIPVPAEQPLYVRLVARNTSGTASTPSDQAGPVEPAVVVAEDVLEGIITETKLADEAVTRAKVQLGAIGPDQLAVGVGNLVPDPSFEGPATLALLAELPEGQRPDWTLATPGADSPQALTVDCTSDTVTWKNLVLSQFPVLPGERHFIAVDYRVSENFDGTGTKIVLRYQDAAGAVIGYGEAAEAPTLGGPWRRVTAQVQAPPDTVSAALVVEASEVTKGRAWFDNAELRTLVVAGLILAESIGANELAADSVVGRNVVAQTITGREIKFSSITGDHLEANSARIALLTAGSITAAMLDADAINGKTIRGAFISGATITGGVLRTAATGQRVVISPGNTNPETGFIAFYSGSAQESAPAELRTALAYGFQGGVTYEIPSISLTAPKVSGSAQETGLFLQAHVPGYSGSVFNLHANDLGGNGVAYINGYGADTSSVGSSIELYVRDAPSDSAQSSARLTSSGFAVDRDLSVHGRAQGRGFVAQQTLTTDVTFSSTQTAIITTDSITFETGRAYRVSVWALHRAPSSNYALYRIRKNNVSGTIYKNQIRVSNLQGSPANAAVSFQTILTNTTGSTITTALCWTGVQGGVAQTWTVTANADNVAYLLVEDCGSANDYAGQAIT
ncbi:hypothetical protein [Streptomyces sp. NPDC002845]